MANHTDAPEAQARKVEHHKSPEMPRGAHVFTPATACPEAFARNASRDHKTMSDLGLASHQQLLSWVTPDGPSNPRPDTWKKDAEGHILQAGNRFSASYDDKGNLLKASLDNHVWEKTGKDQVTETFKGSDGQDRHFVTNGVTDFSVKPWSKDFYGKVAGVDINGNGGSFFVGAELWESAAHQVSYQSMMNTDAVCRRLGDR